ncbi:Glycosyl hydrolase-like 10 domain-containing protein OS=Lysinibacillus sphaericus OX=1421 GN=LS41612_12375 PE=4 SV=1 [Lysinibacillus sphaericus]
MFKNFFGKCLVTFFVLLLLIPGFTNQKATANSLPQNEMRAAWIATVSNIDMKAGMSKTQYTQWVQSTLDKLKANNFNTVIFQVKPLNDALYPSKLAPWSSYITGKTQGAQSGF